MPAPRSRNILAQTVIVAAALWVEFLSTSSFGDTVTLDFSCGVGLLDLQTAGPGTLSASGGRAVFSGANTTMLNDNTDLQQTTDALLTINMTGFNPTAVEPGGLAIMITDGVTIVTATVGDVGDDGFPDVLISDGVNSESVEFFAPNSATNFMTVEYDPENDTASVTIQGFMGNTATLEEVTMGSVRMGVSATSSAASFDAITFTEANIALFPPVFNPANPWVDFAAGPCGNGGQTYPFDTLAEGVSAATSGATVSIVPGAQSTETFAGASAIDAQVTLTNAEPGSGTASIGVTGRRGEPDKPARTGFVARPRSARP